MVAWLGLVPAGADLQSGVAFTSSVLRFAVALGSMILFNAVMYRLGPNRPQRWRNVWPGAIVATVLRQGARYGHSDTLAGRKINLEFVSANPTGPIHIGGTRWAAVGDALGRLLTTQGADVTREYYFNDHGAQIDRFAKSLIAAAKGEPTPEDGYAGEYIQEIAAAVLAKEPQALSLPDDEMHETFRSIGVDLMFAHIKQSLHLAVAESALVAGPRVDGIQRQRKRGLQPRRGLAEIRCQ